MTESGKIVPSNPKLPVKQYFNKPGNQLSSSTILDRTNGVTIDVYEGSNETLAWKSLKRKSLITLLVDVLMDPEGALHHPQRWIDQMKLVQGHRLYAYVIIPLTFKEIENL